MNTSPSLASQAVEQAITLSKQARAAFNEWDEAERQRLLCASPAKEKALREELEQLNKLRLSGKANGTLTTKEYNELVRRTGEVKIELEDIVFIAQQELQIGAVQQSRGWPLYQEEVAARKRIVVTLLQETQAEFEQRAAEIIAELSLHVARLRLYEMASEDYCRNEVTKYLDSGNEYRFNLAPRPALTSDLFIEHVHKQLLEVDKVAWTGDAETLAVVRTKPPVVRLSEKWASVAGRSKLRHQIKEAEVLLERQQQEEARRIAAARVCEV